MRTLAVINTKGGAGKSTLSVMALPTLFLEDKTIVYEIDNNNNTILQNTKAVEIRSLHTDGSDDALDEIQFHQIKNSPHMNIIDCGGGDDSKKVLKAIQRANLLGVTYIVPINDDYEQFSNVQQTIAMIKTVDIHAKIYLVLNRVIKMNEQNIEEQFISLFGSEVYGLERKIDLINDKVDGVIFMRQSPIYSIVKNHYQTTLLDAYFEAIEIRKNISILMPQWANDMDNYKKKMNYYRFSQDVIKLVDELRANFESVYNEGE